MHWCCNVTIYNRFSTFHHRSPWIHSRRTCPWPPEVRQPQWVEQWCQHSPCLLPGQEESIDGHSCVEMRNEADHAYSIQQLSTHTTHTYVYVRPSYFASTSAPSLIRKSTTSVFPLRAARWRGVLPFSSSSVREGGYLWTRKRTTLIRKMRERYSD